jgi:hypothetical protein
MRAPERALREFELAVSLDGNLALAHGYLGLMKFFLGRARETRSHISEAMRLSPCDPLLFLGAFSSGSPISISGAWAARSRACANRSKSIRTGHRRPGRRLGAQGLPAEAAEVCAAARRLSPKLTVKWMMEHIPNLPAVFEGVRKAGLPEE